MNDTLERSESAETQTGQQSDAAAASHRMLSCTNCRQRKTKCDKNQPCQNCRRLGLECVDAGKPTRAKRRGRRNQTSQQELADRLHRIEALIGDMQKPPEVQAPSRTQSDSLPPWMSSRSPSDASSQIASPEPKSDQRSPSAEDGLSKYIGVGLWKILSTEMKGLRQAIDDDEDQSDTEMDHDDPPNDPLSIFRSTFNTPQDLQHLHPRSTDVLKLFDLFVTNVDPICKFLHVPVLRTLVTKATTDMRQISRNDHVEALLFSIYYSSVTSLSKEQCLSIFELDRATLLSKYRAGIERALTNADLLNTKDLGVLQALCLFLLALRTNETSQTDWTLLAVLIRLAHGMGLHRETFSTSLSPFTVEMRRRLWWHIIVLDIRASEDRGTEPIIGSSSFDTRRPLNINDEDIEPASQTMPKARAGFTEMSKVTVHHEVGYLRWQFGEFSQFSLLADRETLTIDRQLELVNNFERSLSENVIHYCDPANPIAWTTSVIARLIMCRVRLKIYYPSSIWKGSNASQKASRPQISNEKRLETAVACMEYTYLVDTEPKVAQWRWFGKTYVQWNVLAVALAELCTQTKGPVVERAWSIVDTVFDDWAARIADSSKGMLWRPIKKLMGKAQEIRRKAKESEQASQDLRGTSQQSLPDFNTLTFERQGSWSRSPLSSPDHTRASPSRLPSDRNISQNVLKRTFVSPQPISPDENDLLNWRKEPFFTKSEGNTDKDETLQPVYALPQDPIEASLVNQVPSDINWADWDTFMADLDMGAQFDNDLDQFNVEILGQNNGIDWYG